MIFTATSDISDFWELFRVEGVEQHPSSTRVIFM